MDTNTKDFWTEICYWNNRSYGDAFKIKKNWIVGFVILVCLVTPATNWMIPMVNRAIKSGITIRYGGEK